VAIAIQIAVAHIIRKKKLAEAVDVHDKPVAATAAAPTPSNPRKRRREKHFMVLILTLSMG
jgi:hypothetical protein